MPHRLSPDQVIAFHTQGFLGPFALCDEDEMAEYRERIDIEALGRDPVGTGLTSRLMSRHMDCPVIRELVRRPELVDRFQSLLDEDLLCWNTYLWNKEPGGAAIPWHQDVDYWPIEPPLTVSAWIAIDAVDASNSCPQVIPGSHRRVLPSVAAPADAAFTKQADPSCFDPSQAVAMVMRAGEFFLFNERTLHASEANRSDRRRLGMSVRVTKPWVLVDATGSGPLGPGHRSLLLAGRDRFGFNPLLVAEEVA